MEDTRKMIEGLEKLFGYYRALAEKSMDQLPEDALFEYKDQNSNSIAIIVKHMAGNMISRWTDFKNSDGEKSWRNRDDEFEDPDSNRDALMQRWNAGWACLEKALSETNDSELDQIIYIRNEGHSILDALHRQLAHYAYHIGQIVFLSKMLAGDQWKSLSIPKHQSGQFNQEKFSLGKGVRHFTGK